MSVRERDTVLCLPRRVASSLRVVACRYFKLNECPLPSDDNNLFSLGSNSEYASLVVQRLINSTIVRISDIRLYQEANLRIKQQPCRQARQLKDLKPLRFQIVRTHVLYRHRASFDSSSYLLPTMQHSVATSRPSTRRPDAVAHAHTSFGDQLRVECVCERDVFLQRKSRL